MSSVTDQMSFSRPKLNFRSAVGPESGLHPAVAWSQVSGSDQWHNIKFGCRVGGSEGLQLTYNHEGDCCIVHLGGGNLQLACLHKDIYIYLPCGTAAASCRNMWPSCEIVLLSCGNVLFSCGFLVGILVGSPLFLAAKKPR